MELAWGRRRVPFEPGSASGGLVPSGLEAVVGGGALQPGARVPFAFEIALRGTETLHFLPLGEMTSVRLASPWCAPPISTSRPSAR